MGKFIRVSHFGLTLVFIVTTIAKDVLAGGANITWTSPAEGDKYGPGDTIIGKWNATNAVVSPSFRLCVSAVGPVSNPVSNSNEGCGPTVWPTVRESAGSHYISLAVPNITSEAEFCLRMDDDFGKMMFSPVFTLGPNIVSAPQNVGDNPGADAEDTSGTVTTPSGTPDSSSSVPAKSPRPVATASAVPETVPPAPTTTTLDVNTHPINPYIALSHTPPPVAAFAVPLSIVGAILLLAGGLSFSHYRKLRNERARDTEKLDLSRRSSMRTFASSSTRHSEVKHALGVLAMGDTGHGPAVPVFPVDVRREQRQPTRQAVPMYAATPAYTATDTVASVFRPAAGPPAYDLQTAQPSSREDDGINAAATHSVISNYLLPSPIPPSTFLSAPQQLHVRREFLLARSNLCEKPLPCSPRFAEGRDIYDVVAQAVGRRIA